MLNCLSSNTTRDEAGKLFKSRWRQLRLGKFLGATEFYLPFYLFRVEVQNGGKTTSQLLAIDAVMGNLDLYSFESVPVATTFPTIETTPIAPTSLSEKEALMLLREKVQRGIYQRGFFQVANLNITGTLLMLCYIPYWVGFYQQHEQTKIEVIDAVRGCLEGAKVRELAMRWFAQEAAQRRAFVNF